MTTEAKNRELLLLFFELDEKPDPAKKEAFLKIVMTGQITRATNMTLHRMLLIQVKYIRKTAWLAGFWHSLQRLRREGPTPTAWRNWR